MNSNGIRHAAYFSIYHPSGNELAERAWQSFKESIKKFLYSLEPVEEKIAKFLLTTGVPCTSSISVRLKPTFSLLSPKVADSVYAKQEKQAQYHNVHVKACIQI